MGGVRQLEHLARELRNVFLQGALLVAKRLHAFPADGLEGEDPGLLARLRPAAGAAVDFPDTEAAREGWPELWRSLGFPPEAALVVQARAP